jgi:protein-disulfide isomerase-like protein with CxxC motif
MARPSKLTPQVETSILAALRAGNTRAAASESVGIDRITLYRWIERDATFRNAVIQAEAQAEVRAVITIRQAYDTGDWRAALAWLERRRHEDWGKRDRIEIVNTVRQLAAAEGLTEEETAAAVAEAEAYLKGLRSGSRG